MAPDLGQLRALAGQQIHQNADLLYQQTATFVLGDAVWTVRCSIRDPQRLKADEVQKLKLYADVNGLVYHDLRQVKHHPDDIPPFPGATLRSYIDSEGFEHQGFDDGTLELLEWSQPSSYIGRIDETGQWVGQRVGTAVLRRP